MSKKLEAPPAAAPTTHEPCEIPNLGTINTMLKDICPDQDLPSTEICQQIGSIFTKLAKAHKAYGEAVDSLAKMATSVTPEQYTILLAAATRPTIQIVVPGHLVTPFPATPPPQHAAETALGRAEIVKLTKKQVLPNPDSLALNPIDKNSATRVLAAVTPPTGK